MLSLAGTKTADKAQQNVHVIMVDKQIYVNTDCTDTGNITIF